MAGYNYAKFISEFGTRTIENQERIDELKAIDLNNGMTEDELNTKHHEVTQLINSLFGLLIVPYEKYKFDYKNPEDPDSFSEQDLSQAKEYYDIAKMIINLEKKGKLYNDYNDNYLVSSFIRHMRNSLAHLGDEGLQFTPIAKKEAISKIIFHDQDETHQFCTELTVGDVRKLSKLLSDMYRNLENFREKDDIQSYQEKYQKYSALLRRKHPWALKFETSINRKTK